MRYIGERPIPKPVTEAATIPRDSSWDRAALLSIGDQWCHLAEPNRALNALRENLSELNSRLSNVCEYSLLRAARNAGAGSCTIGYIERTSPVGVYEASLMLSVAQAMPGPAAQVKQEGNDYIIQCRFGQIALRSVRSSTGYPCRALNVQISDFEAYRTFLTLVEQHNEVVAAGKQFAGALQVAAATISDLAQKETAVDLGAYTFRGPDADAAVDAFFASNIADVNREVNANEENALARIAGRVVSRRVKLLEQGVYEIRGDFISYRLSQDSDGAFTLAASVIPKQLSRSLDGWFSSSQAAKEITSILFATGVGVVVPGLVEHGAEIKTSLRFGNGYASLSRMICGMISEARYEDKVNLKKLDRLFRGNLTSTLLHFRDMSRLESTRLVIDLLVGAIGNTAVRSDLPRFTSPSRPDVQVANSCDEAEGYFVQAVSSGAYRIDSHFLHKLSGEPTALTRSPIVVNGALIPKGTLCHVTSSGGVIDGVRPIRLTLFNLPFDSEGAEVFRHHLDHMGVSRGHNDAAVHAVYDLLDKGP